jgi:ATP-dependent protease ClpP protease subunit
MKRSYEPSEESWVDSEIGLRPSASADYTTNRLYLTGSINRDKVDSFIGELHTLQEKLIVAKFRLGVEPHIELFIDTEGGEIHPALKLYDAIKRSPVKVITVIDGYCASAGTVISLAGKERKITPSSFFMIHSVSFGTQGKLKKVKEDVANASRVQSKIKQIYLDNLTISDCSIDKLLDTDKELDAEEAVRIGLCESYYE